MRTCSRCGKKTRIGRNRSHAQNRSSRTFKANIQKVAGVWLCTKCIKREKLNVRTKIEAKAKIKTKIKAKEKVGTTKKKK